MSCLLYKVALALSEDLLEKLGEDDDDARAELVDQLVKGLSIARGRRNFETELGTQRVLEYLDNGNRLPPGTVFVQIIHRDTENGEERGALVGVRGELPHHLTDLSPKTTPLPAD